MAARYYYNLTACQTPSIAATKGPVTLALIGRIGQLARLPAQVFCDDLVTAAAEHQDGALQEDDITVLVMRAG